MLTSFLLFITQNSLVEVNQALIAWSFRSFSKGHLDLEGIDVDNIDEDDTDEEDNKDHILVEVDIVEENDDKNRSCLEDDKQHL